MANVISLDAMREAAQDDFADLVIPVTEDKNIVLLNPLRLSEAQRDEIRDFFDQLSTTSEDEDEGEDAAEGGVNMFDIIKEILRRVASEREDGEYLIEAIGEDKPLLLTVFNRWSDRTQAGEA